MKAEEASYSPRRPLRQLARDALNAITDAGPHSGIDAHLDSWLPWRSYLASHDNAIQIIGAGVTQAKAEFIEGTTDPNRGGQPRLDFVIYRSDDTFCRIHPGTNKRNDAKPLLFDGYHTRRL